MVLVTGDEREISERDFIALAFDVISFICLDYIALGLPSLPFKLDCSSPCVDSRTFDSDIKYRCMASSQKEYGNKTSLKFATIPLL